jgi:predicted transcriptional regulator of viral defense system
MDIKNPLTKKEIEIINTLKDITTIITNKSLQEVFPEYNNQKINAIVTSLYKKKYLIKIRRANYILSKEYTIDQIFEIACKIHSGYIGLSSALYYYKAIDYEPFTIYVINNKISRKININNYTIKYINLKKITTFFKFQKTFFISSLEKTIFDCFYMPKYSGGFSVISKAIYETQKEIDWNLFIKIYEKHASLRQHQITGYVLDILDKDTDFKIPLKVINYFKNKSKSKTYISNSFTLKFKYVAKWQLKDNVGKENILSWWY